MTPKESGGAPTGYRAPVAAYDTPMVPVKGQTALAWIVVLTIAAIALLIVVVDAFSQNNAPSSITGRTATTSQFVDG